MNHEHRQWVLTCFGTAVGAGILYLPIQAGLAGIWPLTFLTLIIGPVTYLSHRGLCRIVASSRKPKDIIGVIEDDLGKGVSFAVSLFYFLSIITICVGYATGITNIVQSFFENHLGFQDFSRMNMTFIVLALLTFVILLGEKAVIRITSWITYPLIVLLIGLSFFMIPKWNLSFFQIQPSLKENFKEAINLFPVLVFAMNFSPICSAMACHYRKKFASHQAIQNTDKVILQTSALLLLFVMFFVFSMVLGTTPEFMKLCKEQNTDILSQLSLELNTPFLQILIPIISFLAIASSYFGHFLGTREGLLGIVSQITGQKPSKNLSFIITIVMFLGLWGLASTNPKVLDIVRLISAPFIAIYAYLMPVFLIKKLPRLKIYDSTWSGFIFILGLIVILSVL